MHVLNKHAWRVQACMHTHTSCWHIYKNHPVYKRCPCISTKRVMCRPKRCCSIIKVSASVLTASRLSMSSRMLPS